MASAIQAEAYRVLVPESVGGALQNIVDADTQDFAVYAHFQSRLWGEVTFAKEIRGRLLGVDTPEVRGPERQQGLEATEMVRQWFSKARELEIDLYFPDSFGRWLMEVFDRSSGVSLNEAIIAAGYNTWEAGAAGMLHAVRRREI